MRHNAAPEHQNLLAILGDPELCQITLWKMCGLANAEIAARLGCVPPTVERRLRVIQALLSSAARRS